MALSLNVTARIDQRRTVAVHFSQKFAKKFASKNMDMRTGRRPQDESECVYDKPRVEGETEPGWMEEEGKGAYLEAIVTAAKLATISLPSSDAPAPRTDGQTGEHFAAAAAVHVPTRSDYSVLRVRPPAASTVGKEGERLRFSLPLR